jgi:hypothetical protein
LGHTSPGETAPPNLYRQNVVIMKLTNFAIFKKILYDCQKAQRLTIKKQESKLTMSEYLQHKIHLHYCQVCRKFQQFSAVLNQVFGQERKGLEERPPSALTMEEKKEMQRRVDELSENPKK